MNSPLQSKRVLVTGATGFIGSHLVKRLLKEGVETHVLLRNDSHLFRIQDIIGSLTVWQGDIRDYRSICFCVKNSKPQIIFHLATLRNVERDLELVNPMIDINIKGTVNLLKAVIDEKIAIGCFVNTGTCEEYGDGAVPFYESQREIPVSPYSASKVAATYLCQMVFKTTGLPIITLRPFLTYGPYQDTGMLIPSIIHHCIAGVDFPMTEGNQTREFNYIDDVVEGYMLAATCKNAVGEIINIGSGVEYRVADVAEKIIKIINTPIKLLKGVLSKRPGEAVNFFCNNEKAKNLLNWEPITTLDEGLKKTIEWYRSNLDLYGHVLLK